MRLEEITVYHLHRAIDLYLEIAYRSKTPPANLPRPGVNNADSIVTVLDAFLDESDPSQDGVRRYALRLGNSEYPFMKLRLVEYLYRDEFFFTVDTHDQMFGAADDPRLARLMAQNQAIKQQIEAAWEGCGLPTTVNLQGLVACTPVEREEDKGLTILLTEDDCAIQDTIAELLLLKGYAVDRANDGREALRLADPDRHALILMDVEMPHVNGLEACERLKSDPARARIPILLMTAGAIELARAAAPDGFLVKPFQAEALFRFLDAMIDPASRPESQVC